MTVLDKIISNLVMVLSSWFEISWWVHGFEFFDVERRSLWSFLDGAHNF